MHRRIRFPVHIKLLSTADGGRKAALRSGYRSLIRFTDAQDDIGFQLDLIGASDLAPGAEAEGVASVWAENVLPSQLKGRRFEVREGGRVVGQGTALGEPAG
jgi:translation elongation factor EF-Tu-like GTPase